MLVALVSLFGSAALARASSHPQGMMGLSQRKPRNRAKSPSVEQRVSPCFIELIDEDGGTQSSPNIVCSKASDNGLGCALRTIFFHTGQYRRCAATATKAVVPCRARPCDR